MSSASFLLFFRFRSFLLAGKFKRLDRILALIERQFSVIMFDIVDCFWGIANGKGLKSILERTPHLAE
jgi:hypothetical protein